MRCQRDLRELKKTDALTLISQMETRPQHWRLVAGTRPATTLSPVAYITTDFIGCAGFANAQPRAETRNRSAVDWPLFVSILTNNLQYSYLII